ncbi:MAG TPA: bifunctional glutamate N-acetyltransferase/amino-acid acetyltransferase ArgJ [Candidatus Brocadiia bacterium]|nr:bifunctional glutamate N-acetyltransferase/amino-acid acetyltransferase ArgJ [Planctomycetota bacterium]MDO8093589.1 bifunctional glutamate N-acetyltransferase/amino-acid acetyltransferase ArgJ [Candidatus Brocadiales bacterium]
MLSEVEGGVVAPKGFKASAVYCGIRTQTGVPDLGIILSEYPATCAALFTTNEISAAPVKLSRTIARRGKARAVVVNSGNANACTGEQGYRDAQTMAQLVAKHLSINADEVIVASTGIIGHPLPMDKIHYGIESAVHCMGNKPSNGVLISRAIMTTDTVPKNIAVKVKIKDYDITIGGISKGSGMISPRLAIPGWHGQTCLSVPQVEATMLCFLTTDASVPHSVLERCLCQSVERSFNRITVDGHTSTNDMVVMLANGAAMTQDSGLATQDSIKVFQQALDYVTIYLAKAIVRDGEGATKFVEIEVIGARSEADAEKVARSIANSPLVKTAINGEDPNWGRIISAAGYAGVPLEEGRLKLYIGSQLIFENGMPTTLAKENLTEVMKKKDIHIQLDLGLGSCNATIWTCDLSHAYVTINAEYHT